MRVDAGSAWGVVTARGGSKSIPLKNLLPVAGRPMLEYVTRAALAARTVSRVVCSTDHPRIAEVAATLGAEVIARPEHLAGDEANSIDVMIDVVGRIQAEHGSVPEILVLLQPTSLFLTPAHVDAAVQALLDNPGAGSSQTVVKVPHQFHAHNQRRIAPDHGDVWFEFAAERAKGHNKQSKPTFYCYGNLIVTRTAALLAERTLFARPSIPIEIPRYCAYDLDGPEDIQLAELLLHHQLVQVT